MAVLVNQLSDLKIDCYDTCFMYNVLLSNALRDSSTVKNTALRPILPNKPVMLDRYSQSRLTALLA